MLRKQYRAVFWFLAMLLVRLPNAHAGDPAALKSVGLFANFGGNVARSFTGANALLHLAGIGATFALVHTDVDYRVHRFFRNHRQTSHAFFPVVMTGSLSTPAIGAYFYFKGEADYDPEFKGLGSALLQAQIVASLTVAVLKAVTGRPHPNPDTGEDMRRLSRTFRFGFLRGGLFWGWPSGHTASTMALVSTLTAYYPEKTWLKIGGAALMGYTIIGVSAVGGGHMHWFSDAVAAAFMAYAIGHTVGTYYHGRFFHHAASGQSDRLLMSMESMPAVQLFRIEYAL
jgi:membrane-associated phospholipid phosphatase